MEDKLTNIGAHNQKSLGDYQQDCPDPSGVSGRDTQPKQYCPPPTGKEPLAGWLQDVSNKKVGLGEARLCDPIQSGKIVNDTDIPDRNTLFRYAKGIRGCDEAMIDLFRGMVVLDEDGKAYQVPIIWGTQERAVTAIFQRNVRKDDTLVVDRIVLPMLAVMSTGISYDMNRYTYHQAMNYFRGSSGKPGFAMQERFAGDTVFGVPRGIPVNINYTLWAWTMYVEEMNQLLEQIFPKFSPVAYINVRGVPWETIVKLDGVTNNIDKEPGDKKLRVLKYEFTFTAETYIPQPIRRDKAVLKTSINVFTGTDEKKITDGIDRLTDSTEEVK